MRVDVTADVDPHDPASERGDDTTEHNNHDLDEHDESSYLADSNPYFDEISEDNPEDELELWVDYLTKATQKADDLLAASGITWWIFRQSLINWRQARIIATHHEDRWTKLVSNWNPAVPTKQKVVPETRKTGQAMGRRPQHLLATRQIERRNLAHHGGGQFDMGCHGKVTLQAAGSDNQHDPRPLLPRLRQPNQQCTTKQQVRSRLTNKTKTTLKTTTSKTTAIRYSSSLN